LKFGDFGVGEFGGGFDFEEVGDEFVEVGAVGLHEVLQGFLGVGEALGVGECGLAENV
jgi:hypothetical protein